MTRKIGAALALAITAVCLFGCDSVNAPSGGNAKQQIDSSATHKGPSLKDNKPVMEAQ